MQLSDQLARPVFSNYCFLTPLPAPDDGFKVKPKAWNLIHTKWLEEYAETHLVRLQVWKLCGKCGD